MLAKAVEVETILLADDDVALVQTSIPGDGGTSSQAFQSAQLGRATNSATMTVRLDEDADVAATTTRLATALEPVKSDGYDATVSSGGGFTSNGLRVIVTGRDRRMTSPRRPTPSWPDWPTSRTSSTSRATWSRPRPRSR